MKFAVILLGVMSTPMIAGSITPAMPPPAPVIVLVPIPLGITPGALGSVWSNELWIHNGGIYHTEARPGPCRLSPANPCSYRIAPGETVQVTSIAGEPPYTTLALSGETRSVHLSLRTRDLSRSSESAGTEVPVVTPKVMITRKAQLLDVPVDPRFRMTLRLLLDPWNVPPPTRFILRVFPMTERSEPLITREVVVAIPPSLPPVFAGYQAGIEVVTDLLMPLGGHAAGPVRIEVEPVPLPSPKYWVFVSVTDNETQQVTTITPQ